MGTPVILVAGQPGTDPVVGALLRTPGTLVVEHRFNGHVVCRTMVALQCGVLTTAEYVLELAHGCVSCTIRSDLLILLRQLHRRDDVDRIVVHLAPWMEPEAICIAIDHVRVRVAPGYLDGPAGLDVSIAAVVTCVDTSEAHPCPGGGRSGGIRRCRRAQPERPDYGCSAAPPVTARPH
jgi:hypothetical protein